MIFCNWHLASFISRSWKLNPQMSHFSWIVMLWWDYVHQLSYPVCYMAADVEVMLSNGVNYEGTGCSEEIHQNKINCLWTGHIRSIHSSAFMVFRGKMKLAQLFHPSHLGIWYEGPVNDLIACFISFACKAPQRIFLSKIWRNSTGLWTLPHWWSQPDIKGQIVHLVVQPGKWGNVGG